MFDVETGYIIGINSAVGAASYHTPIFPGMFSGWGVDWLEDSAPLEIRIVEVDTNLNVRSEPSTDTEIVTTLDNGDCVIIDRNSGDGWLGVRFNPTAAPNRFQNVSSHFLSPPIFIDAYATRRFCPNVP